MSASTDLSVPAIDGNHSSSRSVDGRAERGATFGSPSTCPMTSLQSSTHSLQMYTPGPATIFFTAVFGFPQKEQLATGVLVDSTAGSSRWSASTCRRAAV
jgi:hypothetical protein